MTASKPLLFTEEQYHARGKYRWRYEVGNFIRALIRIDDADNYLFIKMSKDGKVDDIYFSVCKVRWPVSEKKTVEKGRTEYTLSTYTPNFGVYDICSFDLEGKVDLYIDNIVKMFDEVKRSQEEW